MHVGLVPTISAGIAAREGETTAPKVANREGNITSKIQLRGVIRDIEGYDRSPRNGGNLGVMPRYKRAIADAHAELAKMGLTRTGGVRNLGQFNASVGENGFHINLITRHFKLQPGQTLERINRRGAIRFMPLTQAIAYAENPREVDQMTQVQLYLLALKERVAFNFSGSKRSAR